MDDHEPAAEAGSRAAGESARLELQCFDRLDADRSVCGRSPEEYGGGDGDRGGDAEDAPVERQIDEDRVIPVRKLCDQQPRAPLGEGQPDRCAYRGEQQALDEQLSNQAPLRRAEC